MCYNPGSFSFYGAAVLQKGGDDTVKNAAFEEKNMVLSLSYFFLCVGEGREAAKITSSITGRNQVTNRHRKHRQYNTENDLYFHDGEYSAESKKRTILPKFSITTLGIIIRGRMRERERGKEFKGEKETIEDWRERRETRGLVK